MSSAASLFDMVAVIAVAVIVAVVLLVTLMRRAGSHPYQRVGTLLSAAEGELLDALRQALGDRYEVFPKVALADLIDVRKGLTPKQRAEALARIGGRHAGFVVCDRASREIRGVIELEGEAAARVGHRGSDRFIDAALAAAQIPLLHVPVQSAYTAGELRTRVLAGLHPVEGAVPKPPTAASGSGSGGPAVAARPAGRGAGLLQRVRAPFERLARDDDGNSTSGWLPTRGVLAIAAVLLILGAVLSWFVEPAPRTLKAQSTAKAAPAKPAKPVAPPVAKPAPAAEEPPKVAAKPPEIVGYRDVRVPGRPLAECMGPDNEIGPEVLRCRDGYTKREPIYR